MTVTMTWTWWKILTRRKIIDGKQISATPLNRVLSTFDLTALGIGSTLGVGVYVLAGHLARDTAGPAVIISFLVAAAASVFAGLCYAEFGARVPRAGSAYVYSYVCVGELIAFIIGWTLILEYIIGSASVAKGLSLYIDSLINNTMKDTFRSISPINVSFLAMYVDYFAFSIVILLTIAQTFGLRESSIINNGVTLLNLAVVLFVIIAGGLNANLDNWKINPNETEVNDIKEVGMGGFFPFGFEGMLTAAATCFYGFVGFDCIATTGEEVKNPSKAIPIAIILSLAIIFLSYFGVSTVVTLMWPYYLQDRYAPIPHVFSEIGWEWARWIVSIGGIFGLFASLYGAMFPLPRILYAMANDGLIFQFLGNVSERYKTPVIGTLLAGLLTGVMAAIFDLKQLVDMMSIGTLLAYTIVASSVLILRYTDNKILAEEYDQNEIPHTGLITLHERVTGGELLNQLNGGNSNQPTVVSSTLVKLEVFLFCVFSFLLCICLKTEYLLRGELWATILSCTLSVLLFIILLSIAFQPTSKKEIVYRVPFVPLVPAMSILINIYLMTMLDVNTWIRFVVWMIIGLPIYFICIKIYKKDFADLSTFKSKLLTQNGTLNYAMYNEIDISDECQTIPDVAVQTINAKKFSSVSSVDTNSTNDNITCNIENIHSLNESSDDATVKKDSVQSNSNEENVIALLDEILLNQSTEDTNIQMENIESTVSEKTVDDKQSRKISTDTISSYHAPISVQHSALVHREDEECTVNENIEDEVFTSSKPVEKDVEENSIINDENESLDKVPDNIQRPSQIFYPKTPNISRTGSFLKPNNDPMNNSGQDEFFSKLNSLLINKLNAKPNKVGLVKQANYDSEDENASDSNSEIAPETNSFRDLLHKEIIARKRYSEMKKRESINVIKEPSDEVSSIDESESTKPSDIRFKLEEIFKNSPKTPTSTLQRPPFVQPQNKESAPPTTHENKTGDTEEKEEDEEDLNKTSSFAEQLRLKKKLINDKNKTAGSAQENRDNYSKENSEKIDDKQESDAESETNSPGAIRKKLNLIFATGPRNPVQIKTRTKINTDANKENTDDEKHIDDGVNVKKTEEQQINEQKMLMNNVFKSIELNRKDSINDKQKSHTIPKMNSFINEQDPSSTDRKNSKISIITNEIFSKPDVSEENKINEQTSKNIKTEDNQINTHKTLMSNVFKSIVLNRKDSIKEMQNNITKNKENAPSPERKDNNVVKLTQEMLNKPTSNINKQEESKSEKEEQINKQKTLMNNLFKSIEQNRKDNHQDNPNANASKQVENPVLNENKVNNVKKISQEVFNRPFSNTENGTDKKIKSTNQQKDVQQTDNKFKSMDQNRQDTKNNSSQKTNIVNREENAVPKEKKISNVMKISQEVFSGK